MNKNKNEWKLFDGRLRDLVGKKVKVIKHLNGGQQTHYLFVDEIFCGRERNYIGTLSQNETGDEVIHINIFDGEEIYIKE